MIGGAILVWLICGVIAAGLLSNSNRAGIGCLLGALLGPIGVIVAAVMSQNGVPVVIQNTAPAVTDTRPTKKCPDCAEAVLTEAKKCRFCGYAFADDNEAIPPAVEPPPQGTLRQGQTLEEWLKQPPRPT